MDIYRDDRSPFVRNALTVVAAFLAIVGAAGLKDDLETWGAWLNWLNEGVPWGVFLAASATLLGLVYIPPRIAARRVRKAPGSGARPGATDDDVGEDLPALREENERLSAELAEEQNRVGRAADALEKANQRASDLGYQNTALEKEIEELRDKPPTSDLTEHEAVVAFQELARILEAVEANHTLTVILFHEMVGRMQGGERDTPQWFLGKFVKEAVQAPLDDRLAEFKLAMVKGGIAEEAQEAVYRYIVKYDSARKWMERAARYAGGSITNDDRYWDWFEQDQEIFTSIKRSAPRNGRALGLLRQRLDDWFVLDEVPIPMPKPKPERLRGTDNRYTDDERGEPDETASLDPRTPPDER